MTEMAEMEAAVEAILFVSNDPVPRARLLEVFGEAQAEAAARALEAVLERYRQREGCGVMVDEVAGGVRLVTRPDLHTYLRRFYEASGSNRLSMPALETLAIVAYRQPVTAPEIAELRGVGSTGVLKTLLERRLIRVAGRKEVVGKPFLYATTRDFLMSFGLRSLKELPPLEQFEEMFGGDPEATAGGGPEDLEEQASIEASRLEESEEVEHQRREAEAEALDALRNEARGLDPDAPAPDVASPDVAAPGAPDPDAGDAGKASDPEPAAEVVETATDPRDRPSAPKGDGEIPDRIDRREPEEDRA